MFLNEEVSRCRDHRRVVRAICECEWRAENDAVTRAEFGGSLSKMRIRGDASDDVDFQDVMAIERGGDAIEEVARDGVLVGRADAGEIVSCFRMIPEEIFQ